MTIATATARIVTEQDIAPFSPAPPALLLGIAGANWKYAFNLDEPRGIKLLADHAFRRLATLIGTSRAVPDLPALEVNEDHVLHDHGLIKLRSHYSGRRRPSVAEYSLNVWLHVTNGCNLGCFYCYIPQLQKHVGTKDGARTDLALDSGTMAVIADRLEAYCLAHNLQRLHIKFAGGEPTLAIKQINEFCNRMRSRVAGFRTTFGILTNGVFDPEEVIPVLQRHNFKVSISIDGLQRNHDAIRYLRSDGRRRGTWDMIYSNVARLLESGLRPYFLYTITKKNLNDVHEFASFAAQRGCGFRLSLERANRTVEIGYQRKVADELGRFYTQFATEAPLDIRFDRDARFSEWSIDKKKHIACSTCRGYVAIRQDGQVASCQMRLDEPFGDLLSNDLAEIVERFARDPRTVLLRDPERKLGACTQCEYRFTCAGGCPQHTRDVFGQFDRPSPWCFVYGTLLPVYIEASARHLARRADHIHPRSNRSASC